MPLDRGDGETITALWLAHHYPEDYDRCALVGSRHVCRRCLALYPLSFLVLAVAVLGLAWPQSWDPWVLVVLPIPAVIEFVLEQVGVLAYSAVRTWIVTVPLALALGGGFVRYVDSPGDRLFWGVVLGYGLVCGLAVIWRWTRPS